MIIIYFCIIIFYPILHCKHCKPKSANLAQIYKTAQFAEKALTELNENLAQLAHKYSASLADRVYNVGAFDVWLI